MSRDKTVKNPLFFPAEFKLVNQHQDSPKDAAKKTIEGLIAFCENLILRVSKADQNEQYEIFFSMYIELKSTLAYKKDRTELNKKADILKTSYIESINSDLENYHKIFNEFSEDDLDRIYLSIYFIRMNNVKAMKADMTEQKLNLLLSFFLEARDAKRMAKEAHTNLTRERDAFPLMIESNILGGLLKNLKPHVSSSCLRFLELITFNRFKESHSLNLVLDDHEIKIMGKKALKFASHPAVPESLSRELVKGLLELNTLKVVNDVYEQYFLLYSKISNIFSNMDKIESLVQQAEQKKTAISQDLKKHSLRVEKVIKAAPVVRSSSPKAEEPKVSIIPQILPEVDTSVSVNLELTQVTKAEEPQILSEVASVSIIPEVAPVVESLTPKAEESPAFIIPQIPLEVEIPRVTTIPQILPEVVSDIAEEYPDSSKISMETELAEEMKQYNIYQELYKNKKEAKEVQKPVRAFNTLNLKADEILTYRIVMGLEKGTVLLRDLFNLTQKRFGGWIETTKNNRCHLKFQNIYAFIQLPPEPLEKPCNSASGSMHGGGHRSKPSQNHDRAEAPVYLLEQFADAFTRAGFTEVNLGLDLEDDTQFNPR